MPRSAIRDRTSHAQARVTFAELFFDLVFVFAITQLSHHLLEHLSLSGAAETALLLLAVWIVWVYSTWAINWLDADHDLVRFVLFVLMAGGLVVSTTLPDAFGHRGLAFASAYAFIQVGRTAFTVWCLHGKDHASARNFTRILAWLVVSGTCWILGGLSEGHSRIAWWVLALGLEFGSPWWRFWTPGLGFSTIGDWRVSAHHFAERCGLFVIIALGESILVTGATFARLEWSAATLAAFVAAFAGTVAMWWVYFATTADQASRELAASARPGELARAAYTYAHIPLVAGIVVTAVADELVLAHPGGHTSLAAAAVILGGPALFLAGSALFNRLMCDEWPSSHVVGLAGVGLLVLAVSVASPLVLTAATTVVLVGVGAWESSTRRT
jgi:low temperature requirement protein LtrA